MFRTVGGTLSFAFGGLSADNAPDFLRDAVFLVALDLDEEAVDAEAEAVDAAVRSLTTVLLSPPFKSEIIESKALLIWGLRLESRVLFPKFLFIPHW